MIALLLTTAFADSWCATPLIAHEWGVTVLHPQGGQAHVPPVPDWIHQRGSAPSAGQPVRGLAPDNGIRLLPVLSFFAADTKEIPIAIEVGFQQGAASMWFPAIDEVTPATQANSPSSSDARALMEKAREALGHHPVDLGRDPSRQLHWDALSLSREPNTKPHPTHTSWVRESRAVEALWVNAAEESERFVFYEADTVEKPALVVEAGDTASNHFILRNTSDFAVHDVAFLHDGRVWTAPKIPAGKTAGFLLEQLLDTAALEVWFKGRWAEPQVSPTQVPGNCPMGRHPAIPLESSHGHRIYEAEVRTLWNAWRGSLLSEGTRLLYREDTAALDLVMPLSIYTDMFHDPSLFRLGIVSVEDPALPHR